MKLVFCYIKNYRNIQNQSFDFGSEYNYTAYIEDGYLHIYREVNKKYIPALYRKNESEGFENITAIVGENGSGKPSLLSFLSKEFFDTNNIPNAYHRMSIWDFQRIEEIGEESYDQEIEERSHEAEEYLHDVLLFENDYTVFIKTANIKKIKTNFENNIENFHEEHINDIGALFYSPIYDFNSDYFYRNNSLYIDVSSNNLIENDAKHHDKLSGFGNKTIELHKLQNTARQLDFIASIGEQIIDLKLPEEAVVTIYPNDLPSEFNRTELWNIDLNLTNLYKRAYQLWVDETEKLFSIRNKAEDDEGEGSELYINANREVARIYTYYYLWGVLILHLNLSNHYLTGFFKNVPSAEAITSLRELIVLFINSQSIIQHSALSILDKIDRLIEEALSIDNVSGLEVIRLNIPLKTLIDFLEIYEIFLKELPNVDSFTEPTKFIHFDWGYHISSGERAYMDLFSRFYFAKKQILEKLDEDSQSIRGKNNLPQNLYLLVDEGELGFHLQWQKEYISKLIEYTPKIFANTSKNDQEKKLLMHLILTTHSPISLSDIAQYNIIYMERKEDRCVVSKDANRPNRSFGANIHDLLHDALFLREGFIGRFAHDKIDEVIKLLIEDQLLDELKQEYVKQLIELIDEPIIKIKLKELYAQKLGLNIDLERINAQIEQLQKQRDLIQRRSSNDSNQ